MPPQSPSWQKGLSHNPIVVSITDSTDPRLDTMSNCWLLEEEHYANDFAVSDSFTTDDPYFRSGLPTPSARPVALRQNRGLCLNCHEDTQSLRNCKHLLLTPADV